MIEGIRDRDTVLRTPATRIVFIPDCKLRDNATKIFRDAFGYEPRHDVQDR